MRYQVRPEKLEYFGSAPSFLFAMLRHFPKKMWTFKPSPDRWSIDETILHLADSEASAYFCCRRYIAERGSLDLRFDSARWADSLGYCHQSAREALGIIRLLRKTTYGLLVALQRAASTSTVDEPIEGGLSLDDWLEHHERHILHHIAQMKQNYEIWGRTHPPRKPAFHSGRPKVSSPTAIPAARF
jgi:hypothetical protein